MAYKVDADNEFAKALGVVLRTLRKVRGHKVIVVCSSHREHHLSNGEGEQE